MTRREHIQKTCHSGPIVEWPFTSRANLCLVVQFKSILPQHTTAQVITRLVPHSLPWILLGTAALIMLGLTRYPVLSQRKGKPLYPLYVDLADSQPIDLCYNTSSPPITSIPNSQMHGTVFLYRLMLLPRAFVSRLPIAPACTFSAGWRSVQVKATRDGGHT